MSYNKSIDGWNTAFTSNDLQALRMIWGSEEDGLLQNIRTNDNTEKDLDNSIVDDFSQDTNTLGSISVGETINGSIENIGDRDWFSLDLTAGEILQLQLVGRSSTSKICPCFSCNQKYQNNKTENQKNVQDSNNLFLGQSLRDPFLRLYDSDGNLLYSDDDSGVDTNSLIQFQASYTGKYFASAGAYSDNFEGDYSLTFTLDDFAGDTSSNGEIKYGQEILGNLEVAGDKDWVALNTNEGDQFQIDLIGGTLDDAYLSLYNFKGELVASNDDFSSEGLIQGSFISTYSGIFLSLLRDLKIDIKGVIH